MLKKHISRLVQLVYWSLNCWICVAIPQLLGLKLFGTLVPELVETGAEQRLRVLTVYLLTS